MRTHYTEEDASHTSCQRDCQKFNITQRAGTFSLLNAPTSALTFKTLLRHYAKQVLTQRNYQEGRAAIRHYANQPSRPL